MHAWEEHKEDPHYVWFEAHEIAIMEDGIYSDAIKGLNKLNVVEYDRVNDRYKVLCRCHVRGLDMTDAVSIPKE